MKNYNNEYEGQTAFFESFRIEADFGDRTDGVYRGCLFENKLDFRKVNINDALMQAIIYASRIRIRGEKLPEYIIINHLNRETAYIYKSRDLLERIEQPYAGAASKHKIDNTINAECIEIVYSTSDGAAELLAYINNSKFIKYHVDINNIYGLSRQYYKEIQDKDAFLKGKNAEIRNPTVLADRILPYGKPTNLEFKSIMGCLNPALLQREQGAYYTPSAYVKEMQKMLIKAVSEIPKGMDYIIIDRCAGVGNLETGLPAHILKRCILSTIEPNEYRILQYLFPASVVIPNTDALEFDIIPVERSGNMIISDYIRDCVKNPDCVVILMENPPFSESGSGASQTTGRKENAWKQSFVIKQMKKEHSGVALNDLSNLFIWSGFKYYITKPTDSYIFYSPTKYWRNQNLVNKKFENGFLCDRRRFPPATQAAAIGCIWWKNIDDTSTESITLTPYDTDGDQVIRAIDDKGIEVPDIKIRKAYRNMTDAYDKRDSKDFPDDETNGIICEKDGKEFVADGRKIAVTNPRYNKNIIAYIQADSFSIDRKVVRCLRCAVYNGHGFYVRSDNFLEKLPLFVAAAFPYDKWYKTDVYSKCYDGGDNYFQDKEFLKKCLIYTSFTPKNKCRSLNGSDGRYYRNELCFDGDDNFGRYKIKRTGA
jgi:hypothetical protein